MPQLFVGSGAGAFARERARHPWTTLRAATHLDERDNPFLRRGIAVKTSLRDYYPLSQVQLLRYRKTPGGRFGRLVPVVP